MATAQDSQSRGGGRAEPADGTHGANPFTNGTAALCAAASRMTHGPWAGPQKAALVLLAAGAAVAAGRALMPGRAVAGAAAAAAAQTANSVGTEVAGTDLSGTADKS